VSYFAGSEIAAGTVLLLAGALILALGFECINGFHDTANAVATVIYTNTLRPTVAVVWSGMWNLIGVLLSSGAVAFGVVALLPVELVIHVGSAAGFAMVFALLISAVIWNFATWYKGIPASSSHTLIGSIIGVGLMNAMLSSHPFGDGVNWGKVQDTFTALLVSPLIGFVCAGLLLLLMKFVIRNPKLYQAPDGTKPPTWWVRLLLILTCTGVSFAHGSNDGQKGQGLIMLILIGILPGIYAINPTLGPSTVQQIVALNHKVQPLLEQRSGTDPVEGTAAESALSDFLKAGAKPNTQTYAALAYENQHMATVLSSAGVLTQLSGDQRKDLRTTTYLVGESIGKLAKSGAFPATAKTDVASYKKQLDGMTKFIPLWVKVAVALCLGIGTMIGWRRIVVTIGEKIGKAHLTYGQGAAAEIITYATIQGADILGLPVSTTHILSSGVAGSMAANNSGLQTKTLRDIATAWVLTVPVCVFLGALLFGATLEVILHLGVR
jgi:inorganic phosphate transporter, PiT family